MSFNVAASSIATGVGLTVYGGYKYLTASQKPADETSQQKKLGLGFLATGVAAIAVGAGLIYFSTTEEVASCPINALKEILKQGGSESKMAKTFKVLKDTQGISCDNYLPWQNEFHGGTGYIDRISPTHLKKPAMWGIDPKNTSYVAIKYVCNQNTEAAAALHQRYGLLVSAGLFQPRGCYLGPLDPLRASATESDFLANLTSFFKGGNVVSPICGDKVSILTLAK